MFGMIRKFLFDADYFNETMSGLGDYMPARPALIRFGLALFAYLVNRGVIPGLADTSTGWYASLIGIAAPFLISSGDRNVSLDDIANHITQSMKTDADGKIIKKESQ